MIEYTVVKESISAKNDKFFSLTGWLTLCKDISVRKKKAEELAYRLFGILFGIQDGVHGVPAV